MGQIWLQEDHPSIEIIELDSDADESEQDLNEQPDYSFGNIWNYLDKDRFLLRQPEFYEANKTAREKRRMHKANFQEDVPREIAANENYGAENYSTFYEFTNDLLDKNNTHNYQSNCFTIFNKPFKSPESSSDETEPKEHVNSPKNLNVNRTSYDCDGINVDGDVDATRTIWIYSFKNKRILSENNFELVNIPSQESGSSTSCSLDNSGEESTKGICRVSSPIPATYVPRLNLSLATTLPTVTEISEPTQRKRKTPKLDEKKNTQSVNNWIDSAVISPKVEFKGTDKQNQSDSTNVINWMCLSPRERRRRFKHTNTSPRYQPVLPVLSEVPSEPKSHSSVTDTELKQLQTTAEINVVKHKFDPVEVQTSKRNLLTSMPRKNDQITVVDVGGDDDTAMSDFSCLQKPRIVFNIRKNNVKITDPIEKLQSNNWIHEETRTEEKLKVMDTTASDTIEIGDNPQYSDSVEECAGKKLWSRNMSLLKPVEWTQFMPTADSVPSLHLSIDSDSTQQTWLKRAARCFRCCK